MGETILKVTLGELATIRIANTDGQILELATADFASSRRALERHLGPGNEDAVDRISQMCKLVAHLAEAPCCGVEFVIPVHD